METELMFFLKKVLIWGKWAIFGLKLSCPHKFWSAWRIFLRFCTVKGTKRYMEIISIVFLKKFLFGKNGSKMVRPHNSEFTFMIFLIFCIMKGTKRYMELILMVFLKNFSFEVNGPFWPFWKMARRNGNSGSPLRTFWHVA